MGGFETVALSALGAIQNSSRMRAQNSALAARQQAQANQLMQARRVNERDKRARLASLQATQRARFGAAGIGSGGSADAVMNGLAESTEQSIRDGRVATRMRLTQGAEAASRGRKVNLFDYRLKQAGNLGGLARRLILEP